MKRLNLKSILAAILVLLCVFAVSLAMADASDVNIGDYVPFGNYDGHPMEWLVLDKDGDYVLVISRYTLDTHRAFDASAPDTNGNGYSNYRGWADSDIRAWLNNSFKNSCFTQEEQTHIRPTTVVTNDNMIWKQLYDAKGWTWRSEFYQSGGPSCRDDIFLLSTEEAMQYGGISSIVDFWDNAHDSLRATHVGGGACWWWLRSPGIDYDYDLCNGSASMVYYNGYLYGSYVDNAVGGVRPAFWLNPINPESELELYSGYSASTGEYSGRIGKFDYASGSFLFGDSATDCTSLHIKVTQKPKLSEGTLITTKRFTLNLPQGFSFEPYSIVRQKEGEFRITSNREQYLDFEVYPIYSANMPDKLVFTLTGDIEFEKEIPLKRVESEETILVGATGGILTNKSSYTIPLDIDWNAWATSTRESYKSAMSQLGGGLSFSIYSESNIRASLRRYGFSDVQFTPTQGVGKCGYAFAKKKIMDGGEVRDLLMVVLRGTTDVQDFLTDFDMGRFGSPEHMGFLSAKNNAMSAFVRYSAGIEKSNALVFVTGHSLGAAVANLLAHDLNESGMYHGVEAYTFATPNTTKNAGTGERNIFNMVLAQDWIGFLPGGPSFTKYGVTYYFGSIYDDFMVPAAVNSKYQSFTGGNHYPLPNSELLITLAVWAPEFVQRGLSYILRPIIKKLAEMDGSLPFVPDLLNAHAGETYLSWICSGQMSSHTVSLSAIRAAYPLSSLANVVEKACQTAAVILHLQPNPVGQAAGELCDRISTFGNIARAGLVSWMQGGKKKLVYSVHCPVDITVYDSNDQVVAKIVNHQVIKSDEDRAIASVEGEAHYFVVDADGEYRFEITGTGEGTMHVTAYNLDDEFAITQTVTSQEYQVEEGMLYTFTSRGGSQIQLDIEELDPPVENGTCGDGLTWGLNRRGQLTVSGQGAMNDFTAGTAPWYELNTEILSVVIEEGVTTIGDFAFYGCAQMTSVTIPASVVSIGVSAFSDCTGLRDVYYGSDAEEWKEITIGEDNEALTSATLHAVPLIASDTYVSGEGKSLRWKLTEDGTLVVRYPSTEDYIVLKSNYYRDTPWEQYRNQVKAIVVEGNVSIGYHAFSGLNYVTSVTLADSVNCIDEGAFWECAMTTLRLPASLTKFRADAFDDCHRLESLTGGSSVYTTFDGAVYDQDGTNLLFCPAGKTSLTIADTTLTVSGLNGCVKLREIIIPDTVSIIPENLFGGITWLEEIVIGENIEVIGRYSFANCKNLRSVTFAGTNVHTIGYNAFEGCTSLQTVLYAGNEEEWRAIEIAGGNTSLTGCSSILYLRDWHLFQNLVWRIDDGVLTIRCLGDMPKFSFSYSLQDLVEEDFTSAVILPGATSIGDYAFANCWYLQSVTIPDTVTSIGTYAFCYTDLAQISIPDSVREIGSHAFYNCALLKQVTLPTGLTRLNDWSFYECAILDKIILPNTLQYIGDNVFSGGTKLSEITLPQTLKHIGKQAFSRTSLEEIVIPGSVTEITGSIFSGCSNLKRYSLPDNLAESVFGLGSAFYNCSSLESITIPDTVTQIGSDTFAGCRSLRTITLPSGLKSIGSMAFSGCTALESIAIPNGVTTIDEYTFQNCMQLKAVYLRSGLKYIKKSAFRYCSGLIDVYYFGSEAEWNEINIESYENDGLLDAVIHFIDTAPESYQLILPSDLLAINDSAFKDCTFTSVMLPEGCTSIGSKAFANCANLSYVCIPNGNCVIAKDAFYGSFAVSIVTRRNSAVEAWARANGISIFYLD